MIFDDHTPNVISKISPEESAGADDADSLESLSSVPSSTQPESQERERGRAQAKRSHSDVASSSSSPSLRRPQFGSDWNLPRLRPRKPTESRSPPIQLDSSGKPTGPL